MAGIFDTLRAARRNRRPTAAERLRDEIDRETPEAGNEYLGKTIESIASSRMPDFYRALQDTREGAIRRGITGGDLGTSYEGDITSAFHRNIMNEAGSRAYDAYENSRNRYLDLLTGQRDYDTYLAEQKRRRKKGLFGTLGAVAGGVGGFVLSPPGLNWQGAAAGARAGSAIGSSF